MLKFWCILAVVTYAMKAIEGYNILLVTPIPGKSHSILADGYVRHLIGAGHEVTHVTAFLVENPHIRLHQVDVSSNMGLLSVEVINIKALMEKEMNINDKNVVLQIMYKIMHDTIMHDNIQALLNDANQQFDVVIAERMFGELYSGFAAVFDCPLIWTIPVEPHWMVLRLIDEPSNPAYVPNYDSYVTTPYGFLERVRQLWAQIMMSVLKMSYASYENDLFNKAFGPPKTRRGGVLAVYEDVKFNSSLVLTNSHVSLGAPVRLPQNCKEIGGYHIETDVKPLPEDLKKIMDNAINDVIYFSMGTNMRSKDMPDIIKKDLIQMFGSLKQVVLWKFEEEMSGLPDNVHILKWAPQPSILAHPKCILFVTHGGLLSTTETVYFGVPMVGIPRFGDQFMNVDKAVGKGFAKRVDLTYDLVKDLKNAIEDILSNTKYRESVKAMSTIFHDRLVPPGVELVHWVEHVVRTRGADHLRSPALMVPWYQKMFLDVATVVIITFFIVYKGIKYCCCKYKRDSNKKND